MTPSSPAFTEAWYQRLTFADIVGTIHPTIALDSDLISWDWSSEVTERTTLHLRPGDIVPSAKHTREIAAQLSQASKDGHRSVILRFKNGKKSSMNGPIIVRYNFAFVSGPASYWLRHLISLWISSSLSSHQSTLTATTFRRPRNWPGIFYLTLSPHIPKSNS